MSRNQGGAYPVIPSLNHYLSLLVYFISPNKARTTVGSLQAWKEVLIAFLVMDWFCRIKLSWIPKFVSHCDLFKPLASPERYPGPCRDHLSPALHLSQRSSPCLRNRLCITKNEIPSATGDKPIHRRAQNTSLPSLLRLKSSNKKGSNIPLPSCWG